MKKNEPTSTLQVLDKTRRKIKRRAEKLRSRMMPYVENLLARGMKSEDDELAESK